MTTEIRTPTSTYFTEFDLQERVYLRAEDEESRGIITAIILMPGGLVSYEVTWSKAQVQRHYEFELSDSPYHPEAPLP